MPLRPRSDEIIASILSSFEELVVPELQDDYTISVGHTIVNLLRHLRLRVELEGPALFAGNEELRVLLGEIADFARAVDEPALAGIPADVAEALAAAEGSASGYAPLSRLADDAATLGWSLDRSLRALQQAGPALGDRADYAALRAGIRAQIGRQLEREAAWIVPAFSGIRR